MTDPPTDLVTVKCHDCGPGLVPVDEIALRVNVETGIATMAFPCATCGHRDAVRIAPDSVRVLRDTGVEPTYWHLPQELREHAALPPGDLAPLSGDVHVLAAELESDIAAFLRVRHPSKGCDL